MTSANGNTVVVELTPPGRGAVSVVLIDGSDALRSVSKHFSPTSGRSVETIPIDRIALGRWRKPDGEELILCRRDSQQVEIHCHGGIAAVRAIVDDLIEEGCAQLAWKDWLHKNSVNPIKASARIALADAVTQRTAAILLDQLNGALEAAIHDLINHVTTSNWSTADERIDQLLRWRELGSRLTKPWRLVIVGPPNVGKSSLINALAGYERAIVSPTPGTTRDVVTATTAIDGWPVQLADTAGLRGAQEPIEAEGIKLAASAISNADLVILLHDATSLNDLWSIDFAEKAVPTFKLPCRIIQAINKIDLISDSTPTSNSTIPGAVLVSALTRQGIDDLIATISRSLVPEAPVAGAAVPFRESQYEQLLSAKEAVARQDAAAASAALQVLLTAT